MAAASALSKKLLIKPGDEVLLLDAPDDYLAMLQPLPDGVQLAHRARKQHDVVHLFVRRESDLKRRAVAAMKATRMGAVLWISYPKRSGGVDTDMTRDRGWEAMSEDGWRPVTQVSIDAVWSALRFRPESDVGR